MAWVVVGVLLAIGALWIIAKGFNGTAKYRAVERATKQILEAGPDPGEAFARLVEIGFKVRTEPISASGCARRRERTPVPFVDKDAFRIHYHDLVPPGTSVVFFGKGTYLVEVLFGEDGKCATYLTSVNWPYP